MYKLRLKNATLDETDMRIVSALAENARIAHAELARMVGLSAPSVAERIRRMEDAGVLRGYTIDLDPAAIGLAITAGCVSGPCRENCRRSRKFWRKHRNSWNATG